MDENEVVVPETTEEIVTPEETNEELSDTVEEVAEETPEELKSRLEKAEELAKNYKIRAEKAEKAGKEKPEKTDFKPSKDISTTDLYALMNAKVPEEDISEVKEYANLKKISVAEALKSNVVKTILADNLEKRQTAQATNVTTARRGQIKVTGEQLLANARKGDMPTTDEGLRDLAKARLGVK